MSRLCPRLPSGLTLALLGAMAGTLYGCGQGLHTYVGATDADVVPPVDADTLAGPDAGSGTDADARPDILSDLGTDASADAAPDAGADRGRDVAADDSPGAGSDVKPDASSEPNGEEITVVVDVNGAEIDLPPAHLSIGLGTFTNPTPVTVRIVHSAQHSGGYDPMVEILVPSAGLFRQDAILTIVVPNIGDNQPSLVLGTINPTVSLADQQWIPIQGSSLSADQASVTGPVSEFATANDLLFSAVIKCPPVTTCPLHQTCNSGACQQCPTSSC